MWRWMVVGAWLLLAGCASTHDTMVQQGYPPAFADGFQDGCGSGRQAAGSITGQFTKNVPRYLKDKQYSTGWDDGFRQCQASVQNHNNDDWATQHGDDRERAWQQQKTQGEGRAYHP
ncbi:MAG: hypothetical protein PW845_23275 [Pseudomonas sp.]|uniref:hypothetical protein n=1 Tax=Pseudomonas abieticivorans TaxID=2931382 RepID=UPI0020C181A1|nr:hypothetical protein [Pseudomonas sp. PIA16]MDE1168218.1 hypothetical protein [Pseudomonas sp.]